MWNTKAPVVSLIVFGCMLAHAQYDTRPIRLIVPFAPGSSVDATARPFAQALAERTKQAVVVDNRPGAEGLIGANAVQNAAADGLTIMFASNSISTVLPALKKVPPFDANKDFTPVCSISKAPMNIFMRTSLPFKNYAEFVAAAKAAPGKYTIAYSTGLTRLAGELFQRKAGIQLLNIGYKATAQGLLGILSGEVDLIVADASTAGSNYQSGKMKPLLIADSKRAQAVPDAPSTTELGIDDFSISVWFAVYAQGKVSAESVSQLERLIKSAVASETVKEGNKSGGREEMILCGDELRKFQTAELEHWKDVVARAGIPRD